MFRLFDAEYRRQLKDAMGQLSRETPHRRNTRRWPRYSVDLLVCVVALNGTRTTPVPARGSEISRAGMALHVSIALKPGDLMQLQFPTSNPSRVTAVVRNCVGNCLGLEFLTQLPPDDAAMDCADILLTDSIPGESTKLWGCARDSCNPETLYAGLRRKQQEIEQVQRQIEALKLAILLLDDDETERSRLSRPDRSGLEARAWPQLS